MIMSVDGTRNMHIEQVVRDLLSLKPVSAARRCREQNLTVEEIDTVLRAVPNMPAHAAAIYLRDLQSSLDFIAHVRESAVAAS